MRSKTHPSKKETFGIEETTSMVTKKQQSTPREIRMCSHPKLHKKKKEGNEGGGGSKKKGKGGGSKRGGAKKAAAAQVAGGAIPMNALPPPNPWRRNSSSLVRLCMCTQW